MTVNLIYNRISHHATRSGYEQVCRYLAPRIPVRTLEDYLSDVISAWVWWRIAERTGPWVTRRSGSAWYDTYGLSLEAAAAAKFMRSSGDIYHYLYAESTYRYLGGLKRLGRLNGNKIVCTYHQPPDILDQVVRKTDIFKQLDAVIVVASNQAAYFGQLIGAPRVFVIPLGIDVDFFTPVDRQPTQATQCLFVGQWLRDFDMLCAVAARVGREDPRVRFKVITSESQLEWFHGMNNVEAVSGVDDATLMEAYRSADILLLPFTDCTANCALLEGMACGLPVITTDVGGVRDYVTPECARLIPRGDAEGMTAAVLDLAANPDARARMGSESRRRALAYDWRSIADRFVAVYDQLVN